MQELTQRGVSALKTGDRIEAYRLLSQAVKEQPDDAYAWLWLSGAVNDDEERIACLRQVLRISPGNQAATRGLERLLAKNPQTAQQASEVGQDLLPSQMIKEGEEIPPIAPEPVENPPQVLSQPQQEIHAEREPLQKKEQAPLNNLTISGRRIFRTRPSMVPALASFWLFFFSTILLASLVSGIATAAPLFVIGFGALLQFIVLFVIVRNFRQAYELTDQALVMRFRGKRISIPVSDILHVEPKRTIWQRIRGTADLAIDADVAGELVHLRLRDIPEFQRRIDQIQDLAIFSS
jgi:tetratricopeptide (TPR) repeat protein